MNTDFNVLSKSVHDLDRIARERNSVIGRLHGTECLERTNVDNHQVGDWCFKWVATRGSPFRGMLILKPTNSRTKRLCVLGRVNYIRGTWDIERNIALRLVRASWAIQYVHETRTLALIARSYSHEMWASWNGQLDADWIEKLRENHGKEFPELLSLSDIKINAVAMVVDRYHDVKSDLPYIHNPWSEEDRMSCH